MLALEEELEEEEEMSLGSVSESGKEDVLTSVVVVVALRELTLLARLIESGVEIRWEGRDAFSTAIAFASPAVVAVTLFEVRECFLFCPVLIIPFFYYFSPLGTLSMLYKGGNYSCYNK